VVIVAWGTKRKMVTATRNEKKQAAIVRSDPRAV
jgi:hypothetical protein